jgi:hypothetical protein
MHSLKQNYHKITEPRVQKREKKLKERDEFKSNYINKKQYSVSSLIRFYKRDSKDLLVCYDD